MAEPLAVQETEQIAADVASGDYLDRLADDLVGADVFAPESHSYDKFSKSFMGTPGLSKNINDLMLYNYPEFSPSLELFDKDTGEFSPSIMTADEYYGDDFFKLTPDERRKVVQEDRAKQLDVMYEGVRPGAGGAAELTGEIAGVIADPTTLAIPVGSTYKAAAAIGGAVGGVETVAHQYASTGKLDTGNVALAVVLGTILGPASKFMLDKLPGVVRKHVDEGSPITADEVGEIIENSTTAASKADLATLDPVVVARDINVKYDLNEASVAQVLERKRTLRGDGSLMDDVGEELTLERSLAKTYFEDPAWAANESKFIHTEEILDQAVETFRTTITKKKGIPLQTDTQQILDDAIEANSYIANKTVDEFNLTMDSIAPATKDKMLKDVVNNTKYMPALKDNANGNRLLERAISENDLAFAKGKIGPDHYTRVGLSNEFLDETPNSLYGLATKYVNGIAGIATRPWKSFQTLGRDGKIFNRLMTEADESVRMVTANKAIDTETLLRKNGIAQGSKEAEQLVNVLNKTIKETNVPDGVRKAATSIRKDFNKVINQAIEVGVIPADKGKELLNRSIKKGYWPRMYDEDYLSSSVGREKWMDAMSGVVFNNKTGAKAAIESILGEGRPKTVQRFIDKMGVNKDGTVKLPRRIAEQIYKSRKAITKGPRSAHLERSRKIPEEFEDVLDQFLIKDPQSVLTHYYHDVFKRIEFARVFGAKDEAMEELSKRVGKEAPGMEDRMWQSYYTSVGDTGNSKVLRANMEMNEKVRSVMGSMSAFQMLKLNLAQVANMGQYVVNGSVNLAGVRGLSIPQKFNMFVKNAMRGYGKEARESALRAGAALESTVLSLAGEIASDHNTIMGRKLTGILAPFEIINNPSKFLKVIGFTGTEQFNRVMGHNLGKAIAEGLLSNKAKLLKGGARNTGKIKQIDKQLDELGIDFTIADPLTTPINQMERAGLRFTNEINFINTPQNLPELWQHPYAKLIRQFKTFAFNHGAFIKDKALVPALAYIKSGGKQGSIAPLAVYLGIGTPVGMGIVEFKKMLKGDDNKLSNTRQLLEYQSAVGGLGILLDTLKSGARAPGGLTAAVTGPTASDASRIWYGTSQAMEKGEIGPLAKQVIKTVGPLSTGKKIAENFGVINDSEFKGPDFYKAIRPK